MNSRSRAYLALLGNALIWGLAVPLAKRGFEEVGPMTFLFYRYLFATLAGLPIIIIFRKKLRHIKDNPLSHILPELIGIAILSNILAHWFLYTGLSKTSALETSLLTTSIPILISVGGAVFLKETITGKEKLGTSIAFLGSIIIALEPLWFKNYGFTFPHTLGNLMVLGYNLSWTAAVLWMKKVAKKYHPFILTYAFFVISLVGFLPLAYLENPQFLTQSYLQFPKAFLASFYMGTLGSLGAFSLYQYGQSIIEASEASLFTYLTTIFSALLAIFWLNEKLTLPFVIGGVIVVIGVALAESRRRPLVNTYRE